MFWQEQGSALLASIADRARRDAAFATRARAALAPHGLDGLLGMSGRRRCARPSSTPCRPASTTIPASSARRCRRCWSWPRSRADAVDAVDAFMTWAQVREMAQAGITFGGHGVTHRLLTRCRRRTPRPRSRASRLALERELPGHAIAFCYPNGNWSPAVAAAVRGARLPRRVLHRARPGRTGQRALRDPPRQHARGRDQQRAAVPGAPRRSACDHGQPTARCRRDDRRLPLARPRRPAAPPAALDAPLAARRRRSSSPTW